jgi:hypothetical protein
VLKKKIWANFQRIIELFTPKIVTKLSKIRVWDPRSGKNLFRISDPKVKKDPQHCLQDDCHIELLDDEVHDLPGRRRRCHLDAHASPVRKARLVSRVHL